MRTGWRKYLAARHQKHVSASRNMCLIPCRYPPTLSLLGSLRYMYHVLSLRYIYHVLPTHPLAAWRRTVIRNMFLMGPPLSLLELL